MAAIDFDNLLHKLCQFLAAATSIAYPTPVTAASKAGLWRHSANEDFALDPYSVLRQFGGEVPWVPQTKVSIQCRTVGISVATAFIQAQKLYGALMDSNGRPARAIVIASGAGGFRANAVDLQQPPSFIRLDERKRSEIVFNFDLRVVGL